MRKEIQISVSPEQWADKEELERIISRKTSIDLKYLSYKITKQSLDCRRKPLYHVNVIASSNNDLPKTDPAPFLNVENSMDVIVVGAGPCGLFAALKLIQKGLRPVILERGKDVERRKKDIALYFRDEKINEDSNYCFGEGGAGTFSDGKLYTRSNKKGNIDEVLQLLVYFGAKEEVLYQSHPHIGTDVLSRVVKNIREEILRCGGEYRFDTRVDNFILRDGEVIGVTTSEGEDIMADRVILATGHSARDIYQLFYDNNWQIEAKPFAMGVRVEHPQQLINEIQYHNKSYSSLLPPAEYSLTADNTDRGVFTFCMCPGGIVVPTVDREGIMVVNGMSNASRGGKFADSAVVVTVEEKDGKDYQQYGPLALMKLQQDCERQMYHKGLTCPAQNLLSFTDGKTHLPLALSSYKPALADTDMNFKLPEFIYKNLQAGFKSFDSKMKGFITKEANVIGLESRTSSPVRIVRDKITMQHPQLKHLYPCGEGAGYAGGITSSAIDGINAANKIAEELGV
ncbi:MAG: FAD-binding protein [Bacteroidales bacterium]|nr:FAD-binding protein [Bacteroidales bacterium]